MLRTYHCVLSLLINHSPLLWFLPRSLQKEGKISLTSRKLFMWWDNRIWFLELMTLSGINSFYPKSEWSGSLRKHLDKQLPHTHYSYGKTGWLSGVAWMRHRRWESCSVASGRVQLSPGLLYCSSGFSGMNIVLNWPPIGGDIYNAYIVSEGSHEGLQWNGQIQQDFWTIAFLCQHGHKFLDSEHLSQNPDDLYSYNYPDLTAWAIPLSQRAHITVCTGKRDSLHIEKQQCSSVQNYSSLSPLNSVEYHYSEGICRWEGKNL